MWGSFLGFLRDNQIGDLSDLAALIALTAGFWSTLRGVSSSKRAAEASKKAAEQAERAAISARNAVATFDAAIDFSSAISILEEIKRAHRYGQIAALPDRYAAIRKLLISVRASNPDLDRTYGVQIQGAISNLITMEKSVEKNIVGSQQINSVKFNGIIMNDIDTLVEVLASWKRGKLGVPS